VSNAHRADARSACRSVTRVTLERAPITVVSLPVSRVDFEFAIGKYGLLINGL
jgi:hypothetical protein